MAEPEVAAAAPAPVAVETPPPSWRDTLPDDLRADKSLESFKDVAGLAKSYVETKKLVGAKQDGLVKVPGDGATPEEISAFNKARGVPEAPTGYTVKRPAIAAVLGWDEPSAQQFYAAAHKAGFTGAQVQAAIDWFGAREQATHDANRALEQQTGVALRAEWGANYDANLGIANRALQQYGGDELVEYLHTSKLGAHPLMVKAWAKVGQDLAESGYVTGEGLGGMTREEALAKIKEIDAEFEKINPDSERAKELVEQKLRYLAVR